MYLFRDARTHTRAHARTHTVVATEAAENFSLVLFTSGPGSSVGIATGYGLDGPGIESRWGWGEIFRTCADRPWGSPSLLYNGYRVFPCGKERPKRDIDPSPTF